MKINSEHQQTHSNRFCRQDSDFLLENVPSVSRTLGKTKQILQCLKHSWDARVWMIASASGRVKQSRRGTCGAHLSPQGRYEQRTDYIFLGHLGVNLFFFPPFARNHSVYRHVLWEICCFSQCILHNYLSKTTSGNDKHTVVNLKSVCCCNSLQLQYDCLAECQKKSCKDSGQL